LSGDAGEGDSVSTRLGLWLEENARDREGCAVHLHSLWEVDTFIARWTAGARQLDVAVEAFDRLELKDEYPSSSINGLHGGNRGDGEAGGLRRSQEKLWKPMLRSEV